MKNFRRLILIAVIIVIMSNTRLGVISDSVVVNTLQTDPRTTVLLQSQEDGAAEAPAWTPEPINTPEPTPPPSPVPSLEPTPTPVLPDTSETTEPPPEAVLEPTEEPPTEPPPEPTQAPEPTPTPTTEITEITETPEPTPTPTPPPVFNLPRVVVNPYRTTYPSPFTNGVLSDERMEWSFRRNAVHQPPEGFFRYDIRDFGGDYLGDISRQVVYLTFDAGYDNGIMPIILDILRDRDVPAAFFLTGSFMRSHPELTRRIRADGHIVANHSDNHPDMSRLTDEEIQQEVREVERLFREATGREMGRFFRFPYGAYSMRALNVVYEMGYRTFFWSIAHRDWLVDNQPGKDAAFRAVVDNIHNGAVILLHSISESNAEALPYIIDRVREMGFVFDTLDNIR